MFNFHMKKTTSDKGAWVAADIAISDPSVGLVTLQPTCATIDRNGGHAQPEAAVEPMLPCDGVVLVPENQNADKQGTTESGVPNDPERIRKELAATKAQAAFRGYLVISLALFLCNTICSCFIWLSGIVCANTCLWQYLVCVNKCSFLFGSRLQYEILNYC